MYLSLPPITLSLLFMKNAFIGYTFQERVTQLLLAKMDVERIIDKIEIEANVDNKFDDAKVTVGSEEYYFQIKDFDEISLDDIEILEEYVRIKKDKHKLSNSVNILLFKDIALTPNCEILGFSAFKLSDVYIISSNRSDIDNKIIEFYSNNIHRKQKISNWFNERLDNRKWVILREDLPSIKVFNTELQEQTIDIGRNQLQLRNLLLIEGKPGVGKSHFVNSLTKEFDNSILYRFWISNQDKDYEQRLKYKNFTFEISKKLFNDQKFRSINEIFKELKNEQKTVIIDGLDHVENYNNQEFEDYENFINQLKDYCKVIVLSRPLQKELYWEKYNLSNWNGKQTEKVLNELFHISDYATYKSIYSITNGYPILVRYIAEHYKIHKSIPKLDKLGLESVDSYYNEIIKQEKGKHSLSLFLCNRSFFMKSEIELILKESSIYVNEFIEEHPYLFEVRLNRISLFHDSFNTFLRKQNISYSKILSDVNQHIYSSIDSLNKRFLSRFSYFYLDSQMKKSIIRKFCSIRYFTQLIRNTIDFEAIQSFYIQIRKTINELHPEDLEVIHYYDLSLILNIINRDHVSTLNEFYYTYTKALLNNGFSEEDITSSGYLFATLYYVKLDDATLLFNATSDGMYSTEYFYESLRREIDKEDYFFDCHEEALAKEETIELLQDKLKYRDNLTYILENSFIHSNVTNNTLRESIEFYILGDEYRAIDKLVAFANSYSPQTYLPSILKDAKRNILAYGYLPKINDYKLLSLHDYILAKKGLGSFNLRDEIQNYIRLSLHESREIDISSIYLFWTKYYQRKDYSLVSIDTALNVLEAKGYVTKSECIELIHKIQEVSEKGYRHLLLGFIEFYPPEVIISFVADNFDIEVLIIKWFLLPVEYINILPDKIFNSALNDILDIHQHNKEIDLSEIINVLYSNRLHEIEKKMNLMRYSIRTPKSDSIIKEFENSRLVFSEFSRDNNLAHLGI